MTNDMTSDKTPVIEVTGLNKNFAHVVAATDINMAARRGERIGLIGSNGAGKTTFVNMVTGYIAPSGGTIRIRGRDITGLPPRAIAASGVCRSFQIPQLFPTLSAEENLIVAIGVARGETMSSALAQRSPFRAELDDTLSRFDLGASRHRLASELSSGSRKLLDVAMALARKPVLFLLDEPTSGVATDQKFPLMDIVMNAVDPDVTIMFVEHDMDIVERYAQRVLAFYEGKVLADGPPAEVFAHPVVRKNIVGLKDAAPC